MNTHPETPAIELTGVCKTFGSVKANDHVDLVVRSGTVHGIIGENGAGKSTLMSILYGFYTADEGTIRVRGKEVAIQNSNQAIALGIGMVHQHFMLVEPFTVLENIVLGAESGFRLETSFEHARAELKRLSQQYGLDVDPDAVISDLSVGTRQRVEILKALYRGAEILILDEPTGVLTPGETEQLFNILRTLREEGVTILLITHKLKEIMAITDSVSIMRAGRMVAHRETRETSTEELAELMVGRKVLLKVERSDVEPGQVRIGVKDLRLVDDSGVERLKSLNFSVRAGEIVGVAGVSGNGQSELLDVLSGMRPATSGVAELDGVRIDFGIHDPARARQMGVAHIPEDRHQRGLVKTFSAAETSILGYQRDPDINRHGLLDSRAVHQRCEQLMHNFDVRPPLPDLKSANFSGGNQQKLIIAREFSHHPGILLVGQPTRGVDIGAIEFIHKKLLSLREQGCAILLVSVELDEIMSLSDRIIVMCNGAITGEVKGGEADEKTLGMLMAGAQQEEAHRV